MTEKKEIGDAGEELARLYLMEQGYTILERNWQFGHLEIDIIALKDNTLAFVEVKTRASESFGEPQTAVNKQKQKNIIRAANSYILRNGYTHEARFDIISIVKNAQETKLEHLQDAYSPQW